MVSQENLKAWYQSHLPDIERDFFSFLRFRSISTDPLCNKESRETAKWLERYLQTIGLQAELWETPGLPIVFGSYESREKGAPTLLIYHHYDVQPVDPLEDWISPPFEPTEREGEIYARGAVDNKGQCFYSLTAIRAWIELAKKKRLNLKVFIEGEEESGSRGTEAVLEKYREKLQADSLLVIDCGIPSKSSPAVTVAMRGLISCEVECQNSFADLHSGIHGGIALNPNRVLATLLAGLWDDQGRVTLPGFYEGIEPVAKNDRIDMSFDEKEYTKTFGVHAFCNEEGYTPTESNGIRPTLEINGMGGGYLGVGFKTIIPAKASAKLSCRLVSHQNPRKIFESLEAYFLNNAPKGIQVRLHSYAGAFAYRTPLDASIVNTATLAYEEVFHNPCHALFCGASVPIVVNLAKVSGAEAALIGVGLSSDNIHSPNEHFGWDRFHLGYLTVGNILSRLGEDS